MIYTDMRDAFFEELLIAAKKDKDIIFLTGDQGAQSLQKFYDEIPKQVLNCGPSEQNIINMAAGLTSVGKKVFIHGITPFITLRCFEQISLSLGIRKAPVTIVGIGTGFSYSHEGPTHNAIIDVSMMRSIPGMKIYCPSDTISLASIIKNLGEEPCLSYVRFDHDNLPFVYDKIKYNFIDGLNKIKEGVDGTIIASGNMIHKAIEISKRIEKKGLKIGIIDLHCLKPLNKDVLISKLNTNKVITIEEHILDGGMGSIIAEFICDNNLEIELKRIGMTDYLQDYGPREVLSEKIGLDIDALTNKVEEFIKWQVVFI